MSTPDLADGTDESYSILAATYRELNERAKARLRGSWRSQLLEDVYAALAETAPASLSNKLENVFGTVIDWLNCLDGRVDE